MKPVYWEIVSRWFAEGNLRPFSHAETKATETPKPVATCFKGSPLARRQRRSRAEKVFTTLKLALLGSTCMNFCSRGEDFSFLAKKQGKMATHLVLGASVLSKPNHTAPADDLGF